MKDTPLVSIIIPTYNHAHFLRDALESVRAQTYMNWECIVINNYSEDDTVAVVESFQDKRIRLENFHNNGVIAASRNRGIVLSQGEYLAFLDSDDTWYPTKLENCLDVFSQDVGLVAHGLQWTGKQHRDVFSGPKKRASFDAMLTYGSCILTSATVVKRSCLNAVGGFSEALSIVTSEDYHLWLKLARVNTNMVFLNEILGKYRVHSSNQSHSVLRHMNAVLCVVDEFFLEMDCNCAITQKKIKQCYCYVYYGAGRGMQRNGQFSESISLLLQSIKYLPTFMRCYIALIFSLLGLFIGK